MIYSHELEQHFLAGLLQHPSSYFQISNLIDEKDFRAGGGEVNRTIFKIIKQCIESSESVDDILVAQRVKELNISFSENINITDYIKSLSMRKIAESSMIDIAKDLKKFTIRNNIHDSAIEVASKMKKIKSSCTFDEIIDAADSDFNQNMDIFFRKKYFL